MFKDAIKGLVTLGIGILLIILGFATLAILPLAIICFIAGGSMTCTGLGLIIHNKRNNSLNLILQYLGEYCTLYYC